MDDTVITSRTNPRLKQIAALQQRKYRAETGRAWVEGVKCIQTLLGTETEIKEIVVSSAARPRVLELVNRARKNGADVITVSASCFEKCSVLRHSEGIGVTVVMQNPGTIPPAATAPAVVLWQLQDPGNLGSIIRTAVGLGCRNIVVAEPSVDLFHPMCIRGSAGTVFCAHLFAVPENQVKVWLANNTARVAALTGDGAETLDEFIPSGNEILVIGNEAHGLPEHIRTQFRTIRLPMENNVESLNVTAATAITLYIMWKTHRLQETT